MDYQVEINRLLEERKRDLDQAGVILTKAKTENRDLSGEERQEFEKRHAAGDKAKAQIDMYVKQLEAERELRNAPKDGNRAGRETGRDDTTPTERRNSDDKAFNAYLRGNLSPELRNSLVYDAVLNTAEARALSAGTAGTGGATVPEGFVRELEVALKSYSGVLQAATIFDTSTGETLPYPSMNDTDHEGAIVGENTETTTTDDPDFAAVNFGAYMYGSGPIRVSLQLINDSAFNVEQIIRNAAAERIGRRLNPGLTTGNGSTAPQGIVTGAVSGHTAASGYTISYADLINLQHSVDPAYREGPGVGWMFHDNIFKAIRLLTDNYGRPLFVAGGPNAGLDAGAPDQLLGNPFYVNQAMASVITVSAKTVLFGRLNKYHVRRVGQFAVLRLVERYAEFFQVGFLGYQRYDGKLIDAGTRPIKFLTQSASTSS
jgi:HK97 family phage major capsid protein